MSLFLIQNRQLTLFEGAEPTSFPCQMAVRIKLGPEDAFGIQPKNKRNVFQKGEQWQFLWDANEGTTEFRGALIRPIHHTFQEKDVKVSIHENALELILVVNSFEEATRFVFSANSILPAVLSYRFQAFVWIKDFLVLFPDTLYKHSLPWFEHGGTSTTADLIKKHCEKAINLWFSIEENNVRLVSAYYYFRQSIRFLSFDYNPTTVLPEIILNLAKSLEIIFTTSTDTLRIEAAQCGIDNEFIEQKLVPIYLLRSKFGCAHVSMAPVDFKDIRMIQEFIYKSFSNVQYALDTVWEAFRSGKYRLRPIDAEVEQEKVQILESIQRYLNTPNKEPL